MKKIFVHPALVLTGFCITWILIHDASAATLNCKEIENPDAELSIECEAIYSKSPFILDVTAEDITPQNEVRIYTFPKGIELFQTPECSTKTVEWDESSKLSKISNENAAKRKKLILRDLTLLAQNKAPLCHNAANPLFLLTQDEDSHCDLITSDGPHKKLKNIQCSNESVAIDGKCVNPITHIQGMLKPVDQNIGPHPLVETYARSLRKEFRKTEACPKRENDFKNLTYALRAQNERKPNVEVSALVVPTKKKLDKSSLSKACGFHFKDKKWSEKLTTHCKDQNNCYVSDPDGKNPDCFHFVRISGSPNRFSLSGEGCTGNRSYIYRNSRADKQLTNTKQVISDNILVQTDTIENSNDIELSTANVILDNPLARDGTVEASIGDMELIPLKDGVFAQTFIDHKGAISHGFIFSPEGESEKLARESDEIEAIEHCLVTDGEKLKASARATLVQSLGKKKDELKKASESIPEVPAEFLLIPPPKPAVKAVPVAPAPPKPAQVERKVSAPRELPPAVDRLRF